MSHRVIGERVGRLEDQALLTGKAQFIDDIEMPGMLEAAFVRSPHPHALIKRIDVSAALALPGVKAIVTGEDTPNQIGLYLKDRYIFCRDRVRYVGDPVAGVIASSNVTRGAPPPRLARPRARAWSTSSRRIARAPVARKWLRPCQLTSLASTRRK